MLHVNIIMLHVDKYKSHVNIITSHVDEIYLACWGWVGVGKCMPPFENIVSLSHAYMYLLYGTFDFK